MIYPFLNNRLSSESLICRIFEPTTTHFLFSNDWIYLPIEDRFYSFEKKEWLCIRMNCWNLAAII